MAIGQESQKGCEISKLKRIVVCGKVMYHSLSFDIGDYDGIYWLQIYDLQKRLVYDKPFASARGNISNKRILETIREQQPFIRYLL